jgi:hypothetical protein
VCFLHFLQYVAIAFGIFIKSTKKEVKIVIINRHENVFIPTAKPKKPTNKAKVFTRHLHEKAYAEGFFLQAFSEKMLTPKGIFSQGF